jgi:hypothetical protein
VQNRPSFSSEGSYDEAMPDIGIDDPLFKLLDKLDKVPSEFNAKLMHI